MTNPLEFVSPKLPEVADDVENQRERRELLIARRGGLSFGVFATATDGIVEWKEPTPLPAANPGVLGLVCVRGRMFTVIDPSFLLSPESANDSTPAKFIVLLAGDEQLALAVERVTGINEIFLDEIETQEGKDLPLVVGRTTDETNAVAVLEPGRLFTAACGSNG
jgi:chemotaxis signal transduction protein